jgi:hypothetical protein
MALLFAHRSRAPKPNLNDAVSGRRAMEIKRGHLAVTPCRKKFVRHEILPRPNQLRVFHRHWGFRKNPVFQGRPPFPGTFDI